MREFDAASYLLANPDVKSAVEDGRVPNAWTHFVMHGFRENRNGVDIKVYQEILRKKNLNILSIDPPKRLMKRVHGSDDADGYNAVGRVVAANVFGELIRSGLLEAGGTVLDFGCGPGRVIRQLYYLIHAAGFDGNGLRWIGRDIDPEGIEWAARYLSSIGEFSVNEHRPPLDLDDESIDFLYAISVFTHLPEDMQLSWLRELRRVVRIGGFLVLTSHGPDLFNGPGREAFLEKGFAFVVGKGNPGLPSFYQTSYHTHSYIRSVWGQFFSIEKVAPRGIAHRQDLILCRRTS